MLSVDLWTFFAPVLAGSLACLGFALIYWLWSSPPTLYTADRYFLLWFKLKLSEFLIRPKSFGSGDSSTGIREALLYPVLACAVFGLGVVLDAAVDDFVDGEPTAAAPIRWIGAAGLPRENDLRFSALFDRKPVPSDRPQSWWKQARQVLPFNFDSVAYSCESLWPNVVRRRERLELSGLGDELLQSRETYAHFLDLRRTPADVPAEVAARRRIGRQTLWCPQSLLATDADQARSCSAANHGYIPVRTKSEWEDHCKLASYLVRKLYYDASNYTRRDAQVSSELNRWQAQRGLLGATHLVCTAVTAIILVWFLARRERVRHRAGSALAWLALMAIGSWISAYGFTVSSRNFMERTLGIYSSAVHHDKNLVVAAGRRALLAECDGHTAKTLGAHLWHSVCYPVDEARDKPAESKH